MINEIVDKADTLGLDVVIGPEYFGLLMAFARITGVLHTAPLIGSRSVPPTIRVALAGVLAFIMSPLVAVDPAAVTWHGPKLAFLIFSELLLGLGMGFVGAIALSLLDIAGTFVGINSGLAIASQFDPLTNSQQLVLSRLLQIAGYLAFFAYDLHHLVFLGMADSFIVAPPGPGCFTPRPGSGCPRSWDRFSRTPCASRCQLSWSSSSSTSSPHWLRVLPNR